MAPSLNAIVLNEIRYNELYIPILMSLLRFIHYLQHFKLIQIPLTSSIEGADCQYL
jgi:hypothetical protein